MSRQLQVVAVAGSVSNPSKTSVLVGQLLATLAESVPIQTRVIELGRIAEQLTGAIYRSQLHPSVEADIAAIESADLLVVASPVYREAYTGLFKRLFDFVHHEALIDVPVLLAATDGSERYSLVIDNHLRPLFSSFQSRTLQVGVYESDADFDGYEISRATLCERIALAVEKALPLLPHT